MSSKLKNFIKGIIVIVVFAAALMAVSRVLMLKSEDGYTQIQSYYKQKENTVDVLFLGSSKIYCQVDTGILWDEYGISSFDLGGAEATTWNTYYYLKEALKTQKPKVIIYDAGIIGYRFDVEYQTPFWAMTNNYGMKWNENRINQLKENCENERDFKKLLYPLDTMHSRYSDITKNDFIDPDNDISYKGFDFRDTTQPFEKPDMSAITDALPISEKQEKYFLMMAELCNENDIPFIVMVSPYYLTEDEQRVFNYLGQLCEANGITYYDYNRNPEVMGIDYGTDFAENVHLNFSGTKKLSEYLGKYVKDNYDLEDHRGDANYSSWDRDALINRQNRLCYDLNHTEDVNVINELLLNENYIVINVNNEGNLIVTNASNVLAQSSGYDVFEGNICEGDSVIKIQRSDLNTTVRINNEEYYIGWPWDTKIVYDRALDKIVLNRCFYTGE